MKPAPIPDDIYQKIGYRVDLAWMIMSAKNSGSDVHTDPDMTGAWNYLLSGKKHWVVFPQGIAGGQTNGQEGMSSRPLQFSEL